MIKISISVDDGAYDSYKNIFPLLKKYNLPATFSFISGYIDGKWEYKGIPYKPITWEEFNEIKNCSLIEVSNHSYDHTNKASSIVRGRKVLNQHIGQSVEKPLGFASPESKMTETYIKDKRIALALTGCSYVRTGIRVRSYKFARILARKAARVTHFAWLFNIAYHDTLLDRTDDYILFSVPIMKDTTLSEVVALVKQAVKKEKNLILLFHRILKPDEENHKENWYWDYREFDTLLQFLRMEQEKRRLKVVKTCDLRNGQNDL